MSLRIRVRRCPACRASLEGDAGRAWLVCPSCPTAIAFGSEAPVSTSRPRSEVGSYGPRLAFWLFRLGPERTPCWVSAFRCFNQPSRPDLDVLLSQAVCDPPLAPAPLGALLARGPDEATAILAARHGSGSTAGSPQLVSLAVERDGDLLREPTTGWSVLARLVRPAIPVR